MSAASRAGRTREQRIQSQIARIIPNRRQKTSHERGELHPNTIVSRLPNGMPINNEIIQVFVLDIDWDHV